MTTIAGCIAPPAGTRIHFGTLGSGETIPCCPTVEGDGPLLRVETSRTRPIDGPAPMMRQGKCALYTLEVEVNYRQCFVTNTGKVALTAEKLSEMGGKMMLTWIQALDNLFCCRSVTNVFQGQRIRYAGHDDVPPDGGCAGWTMRFECDIVDCDGCPQ